LERRAGGQGTMVTWFSASLLSVVSVDAVATNEVRSVVLFQSENFDTALIRATKLGRNLETTYENADRRTVRWQLVEVETLDLLGDQIEDGREVYSEPIPPRSTANRDWLGSLPLESSPTQSGA
jgi:hypothetical protein